MLLHWYQRCVIYDMRHKWWTNGNYDRFSFTRDLIGIQNQTLYITKGHTNMYCFRSGIMKYVCIAYDLWYKG